MTPKEKANELISKFLNDKFIGLILEEVEAKQCALIAVDELIEHSYQVMKPFWVEVKQELELL